MTMNAAAPVRISVLVLSLFVLATTARAEVLEKSKQVGRVTVQYKVVLPTGYDAATYRREDP